MVRLELWRMHPSKLLYLPSSGGKARVRVSFSVGHKMYSGPDLVEFCSLAALKVPNTCFPLVSPQVALTEAVTSRSRPHLQLRVDGGDRSASGRRRRRTGGPGAGCGTDRSQVDSGVWDLGAGSVNPAVIPESLAV